MREILNEFEESISNAEYKDDVYEQRKEIGIIVEYYIQKKNPEIVQVLELDEGDGEILRNVLFKIYDEFYLWGDCIINGLVEASQLEHIVNNYIGEVLWSTQDNASSITAAFFKLYYDHKFTIIETRQ